MHICSKKPRKYKGITRQPGDGTGLVMRREHYSYLLSINDAQMHLGLWWLEAAEKGLLEALPVVNLKPVFENQETKCNVNKKKKSTAGKKTKSKAEKKTNSKSTTSKKTDKENRFWFRIIKKKMRNG